MNDSSEPMPGNVELVGRDRERRELRAALDSAVAGHGLLLLVGGEAGIGKTALVEDFITRSAARLALVLTGACYDVTMTPPYGPWTEALQPRPISSSTHSDPLWFTEDELKTLADQTALFNEVRERIARIAANQPVVIVLEDLHWADRESLDLLRYLGRTLTSAPVLMIATYRSDELMRSHPLYHLLPNLVREAKALRIDLLRFSDMAIQQLIDQRYALEAPRRATLSDYLEARTNGNPFFMTEVLRSLELTGALVSTDSGWRLSLLSDIEIPLLVRQMIDRRLMGVSHGARLALQSAAVLGYEIRPDLWLSIVEYDEAGLSQIVQQALDAYLLEQAPQDSQLRFRHALVREALYTSLPLPWRQLQHLRIAISLSERGDTDPAIVAAHFQAAGDRRAATWLLRAAREARRLYAPHAVVQHLDSALALEQHLNAEDRMEAFQLRGWAHEMIGAFELSYRDYQAELSLARETGQRRDEWDALIRIGDLWAGRDYQRTGEYVESALELAVELADERLKAHSMNRMGNWYVNVEEPDRAREYHGQALEIFHTLEDRRGIASTLDLLGMTAFLGGDLFAATTYYNRAIELFRSIGDQQGLVSSLTTMTNRGATYQTDTMVSVPTTLAECSADGDLAYQIASSIAWRAGEIYALWMPGFCHGARGDYGRAISASERSIPAALEIGHRQWLAGAQCMTGALYIDLLDYETAREHLAQANAFAREMGSRHWTQLSAGFLALAYLSEGAIAEASRILMPLVTDGFPSQTLSQRIAWCARIELALATDEFDEALRLVDRMLAGTPHLTPERPPVRLAVLKARALIGLKAYESAEQWLTSALVVAREQGARSTLWRVHRLRGILQSALGQRLAGAMQFAEARRIISQSATTIGDPAVRERFERRALSLVPVSRQSTSLQKAKLSYGGLTRRQREVAALLAAGWSNRNIAHELSISERTVESHVTAILATLDLNSRAQVAAWAVEHGMGDTAAQ